MRAATLVLLALLTAPLASAHGDDVQHLIVTMHNDDGFYFEILGLEGQNPDLPLTSGITYEITVRNDGTMAHDFNLGALGGTALLSPGESETLTVSYDGTASNYWCNPHRNSGMEGRIVEPQSDSEDAPGFQFAVFGAVLLGLVALRRRT